MQCDAGSVPRKVFPIIFGQCFQRPRPLVECRGAKSGDNKVQGGTAGSGRRSLASIQAILGGEVLLLLHLKNMLLL